VKPTLQVPEYYLPLRAATGGEILYRPMLLGAAEARFTDLKLGVDVAREVVRIAEIGGGVIPVNWAESAALDVNLDELSPEAPAEGRYGDVPAAAANPKSYAAWARDFAAWVVNNERLGVFRSGKLVSRSGESERDFRIRLRDAARERRDADLDKLRRKYRPKIAALDDRLRRERQQAQEQKLGAAVSFGSTLLGAFMGRRGSTLSRAGTAARAATRVQRETQDVASAQQRLNDLQAEFDAEVAALQSPVEDELETVEVRPKKTNVAVRLVALVWAPYVEGQKAF
jgi:hypothetical protein